MKLIAWAHETPEGWSLRGWHTPPTGRPILHVLHGNGFCGRVYEPLLAPLAGHLDLWLCDVQGHGDSDHGGRFLGWNRNAELAVQAFTAHRERLFGSVPACALGHSFGGVLTALALADHPTLFTRAVLLDPVILPAAVALALTVAESTGVSRLTPMARAALQRRSRWPDRKCALDGLRDRGVYRGWREDALQAFVQHAIKDTPEGDVSLKCAPEHEAAIFGSAPVGLWAALRRVRTPTLLMHAEDTFDFVAASARQWQSGNRAVSLAQVPGGHCFMLERPEETAAQVLAFLQGPGAAA